MTQRDLRVLFLQGAGVRAGAERALLARVRHLPERGIEPAVAFLADGPFREEVQSAGVRTFLLGEGPHLRDPGRLPAVVRGVASLARSQRVDVIEGCGEKMSLVAGWAARLADCGGVYNLQDAPRRDVRAAATQLAALTGRHDEVVVPSRWMARAFRSSWAVRARVIPNAMVLSDTPETAVDVRRLAGWPADSAVVGLFGRLVAWKGAEVLLRAAAGLSKGDYPQPRFLIGGGSLYGQEPAYPDRLAEIVSDLGLTERVHLAGHREDALAMMSDCDVLCHCSTKPEPFGMVVIEAMALGKPVIATRTGGPEEILEHGRTGILLDPGDDRALAAAIDWVLSDEGRRRRLGDRAASEARARFASPVAASALEQLYRDVVAGRAA